MWNPSLSRFVNTVATNARFAPLALLLFALAPLVFGWAILPLQDLPDWSFQAELLRRWTSGTLPEDYGTAPFIAPNALSTLLLAAASSVVGPDASARLLSLGAALILPWGATRLLSPADVRAPLAWFPLLFGLSYPLLHGNINSVIGLGVFLAAAAWALDCADGRAVPNWIPAVTVPLLLYLAHGVAYCAWAALALTAGRKVRKRLLLAALPSACMALHYAIARSGSGAELLRWSSSSLGGFLLYKLDTVYKQLAPLSLFDPFFVPSRVLWAAVVVNYIFVVSALLVCARRVAGALRATTVLPSVRCKLVLIAGLLCAFLVAPTGLAGLVNPGERLVLPVILMALSLPPLPESRSVAPSVWSTGLISLLATQLIFVGAQGFLAGPALADVLEVAGHARGEVFLVHESHLHDPSIPSRSKAQWAQGALPRHHPLLRVALYAAAGRAQTLPIFATGLFECRVQDLLVRDLSALQRGVATRDVVVVGEPTRVAAIASALPGYETLVSTKYGRVLRALVR
jgi:hypothetical protein